jgi:O-methyltransferase involved in polyketide biosynthesis/DNA-binding MarR family transcriptional regulator
MNNMLTKTISEELVDKIVGLMKLVNQLIKEECRKVIEVSYQGKLDFSADEVKTLRAIHALNGKVTLRRVVEHLEEIKDEPVHSSTVSAIMTRFETDGLLLKEINANDKRQPLNSLSPKGEKLAKRFDEVEAMVIKNIVGALQLDEALVASLNQRVGRACDRIKQQLQTKTNIDKPSMAGVYDYALGGILNSSVDRKFYDDLANAEPWFITACRANRAFLQRAVCCLSAEHNITQFLDIGSGYPTNRNAHEVAIEKNKQAHVTYIDNNPDVVRVSRFLLEETENVRIVQGDVRFIKTWLTPEKFQNIDFNKPVGILMTALLHFVIEDEVREIINFLKQTVKPGSYLVFSHATNEDKDKALKERVEKFANKYNENVGKVFLRSKNEITPLLEGLDLVDPGLVPISKWRTDLLDTIGEKKPALMLACVAKF